MVKKAAQAVSNQLLRQARLERGWSQRVVAERIGAPNHMMVTRWERGKAFPSPYYVERLCLLFERKASALGLLRDPSLPGQLPPSADPPLPACYSVEQTTRQAFLAPFPLFYLPLIGREADIDALRKLYQVARQGQMQVVLLQGEAGMGKTRLATAFLQWAAAQGATLLQGQALEMGGRLPYHPLVHALSRRLEQEAALEGLLGAPWLSELSRLLPELRERYPHLPVAPGDETTAQIRLFEAVARLLQALGEQAPVVLFIDDIQWADVASLDVLHYAGQRWRERGTPLLLLLAVRSEILATTRSLHTWLTGLHHDLPVTELVPGPLTQDETLHLLATLGTSNNTNPQDLERLHELGQWLFRETRGQPFYLVETLRVLLERQILTLHRQSDAKELVFDRTALEVARQRGMIPPGIRRLILSQLERLTAKGRALVNASAILGQRASFDLLCRVADLPESEALVALAEVLASGLLRDAREADDRGIPTSAQHYLIGHDKIREVIAAEMGEAQRRFLHRRSFSVLEALGGPAAELAHHALEAGMMEQAVHLSLRAGDEAVRLLAEAEASLHYTWVLEALSQFPETASTRDLRAKTVLKLVQFSFLAMNVEHTLERLAEARCLVHVLPDQRRLGPAHDWIGDVYSMRNDMGQAREYAEHVLEEARKLGDEELAALASVQLSRVLILQGYNGPIEGLLTPALPVLEQRERWLDWTYARGFLGIALAARGHYARGVSEVQCALERARRAGEAMKRSSLASHFYLSLISLFGGEAARMFAESQQAVEGAEQLGDEILMDTNAGVCAWAESRLGKHEEAIQRMERVLTTRKRLGGHLMDLHLLVAANAELFLAAGRVEEALVRAQGAVELARGVGSVWSEGIAQRVWGQALGRLARWEEAEAHLAESCQLLLSGENLLEAARTRVAWGLLCHDRGEIAFAREHVLAAAAQFEVSGLVHELETVQRYLAWMDAR